MDHKKLAFCEEELQRVGSYRYPSVYGDGYVETPKINTPVTSRENLKRVLDGEKPLWLPHQPRDLNVIHPKCVPDVWARLFGGKDWFGIDWQYEELSRAAMVRAGTRRLSELSNWRKEIVWPELTAIDWEKDAKENYNGLPNDRMTQYVVVNGLFERLADLTSFEDALCYLLEEPEEVEAFFERLMDWHLAYIMTVKKYYHVEIVLWHDDMGAQKNAFFSPEIYKELLLPHYQRMTKKLHEENIYVILHSCGNVRVQIPNFIEAGFDAWEGQNNANDKLALMEEYGEELAQYGGLLIPPGTEDKEAMEIVQKCVETLGAKGRYVNTRINDEASREIDLADELYRYSRTYYSR